MLLYEFGLKQDAKKEICSQEETKRPQVAGSIKTEMLKREKSHLLDFLGGKSERTAG